MIFLRICRPIYRVGNIILMLGIVLVAVGLIIGMIDEGWMILVIGIGGIVLGIITSQIPTIYLSKQLKTIDESLAPKQTSNLALEHLQKKGNDAEDTLVFLADFEYKIKLQKRQGYIL
jgi:hypothetical protein